MNPKISFYGCLLVLIISACSKEPASTINKGLGPEPIPKHYIKTGEKDDSSIIYTSFEPALHIKGENLYDGDGYEHRDSLFLDVNHDGTFDLRFDYRDWYYESDCPEDTSINDSIVVCCFPDAGSGCHVKSLSNIEILRMWDMNYRPKPLTDSLVLNDYKYTNPNINDYYVIDGFAEEDSLYWMGSDYSSVLSYISLYDSWDSQESHYLGFRFPNSDTTATHGWINLTCKGTTCIEIYDMAIEK